MYSAELTPILPELLYFLSAAGLFLSVIIFVFVLVSFLLNISESPQRKIQKRLQSLQNDSQLADTQAARVGTARLSSYQEGDKQKGDKGSTVEKLKNRCTEGVHEISQIPVIRVVALPFVARIEQHKLRTLRDSCMNDLPEMVDILSLALGAGLSIDQSFEWYLSSYDTPLAGEFRRAEQAYQAGMLSRMKAFENLAESLQEEAVLRFVNALRQAFALGSALGPALSVLSQDVRKYRVVRIEERIAKTPVKILAPLGLCIVPAVLILLMGPIMSQVLQGFQL
ncbi:MAG: type II secretion system F family protein [Coriobacteriia bacterium]|nr:type II secretion system F family protein [Coriobacteriia bacterium]